MLCCLLVVFLLFVVLFVGFVVWVCDLLGVSWCLMYCGVGVITNLFWLGGCIDDGGLAM